MMPSAPRPWACLQASIVSVVPTPEVWTMKPARPSIWRAATSAIRRRSAARRYGNSPVPPQTRMKWTPASTIELM